MNHTPLINYRIFEKFEGETFEVCWTSVEHFVYCIAKSILAEEGEQALDNYFVEDTLTPQVRYPLKVWI